MQTTIQKWGNSQGARIPKVFLEAKKAMPSNKLMLDDIFEGYGGDYDDEEYGWGKPVGREVW